MNTAVQEKIFRSNQLMGLEQLNRYLNETMMIDVSHFNQLIRTHVGSIKMYAKNAKHVIEPTIMSDSNRIIECCNQWGKHSPQMELCVNKKHSDINGFNILFTSFARGVNSIDTSMAATNKLLVKLQGDLYSVSSIIASDLHKISQSIAGEESQIKALQDDITTLQNKIREKEKPACCEYFNPANWFKGMYTEVNKQKQEIKEIIKNKHAVEYEMLQAKYVTSLLNGIHDALTIGITYSTTVSKYWQDIAADAVEVASLLERKPGDITNQILIYLRRITGNTKSTKSLVEHLIGA